MKRFVYILISSFFAFMLVACSTTNSNNGANSPGAGMGSGSATAAGLGRGQMIAGYNTSASYRLRAPYNQLYFFDFDKDTVHSDYLPSLSAQANYLIAHPNARILLIGDTDERGSREYNIALGNRRALAVRNQLQMDGVNPKQIRWVSYGAEKPLVPAHNERAYAINRNVQLIYKSKG